VGNDSARQRSVSETRSRILDAAVEILGDDPDAAMGQIAVAAGVVRRTVYGHFPSRNDLIRSIVERATDEMGAAIDGADAMGRTAPQVWADFVSQVWVVARRYRVLIALRRSEYGQEIHALLKPVDDRIADLVRRGQAAGTFGEHLPAGLLGQIALATVFSVFDSGSRDDSLGADEATVTSLLILGVPVDMARELADGGQRRPA
jgi:AcrR family transcriptional regulator